MDLEILEALALGDRAGALSQLLPGSEDHDYYRCLHAQHAGALAEADAILDGWAERHGATQRYETLRLRQLLYRLGDGSRPAADEIRDRFGVSHWHEAEAPDVDTTRPTRLRSFDGGALLREALSSADLAQVTDEGLYELLGTSLDRPRRSALLARISHTPDPALAQLVAADLADNRTQFGTLRAHGQLTLEQLQRIAMPMNREWVHAVVRRMQPPSSIDLAAELPAREAYLVELWAFLSPLPPANNSLKGHVLWHLLETQLRRDAVDPALFEAYLALPRQTNYSVVGRRSSDELVQLGATFHAVTGLPPAGADDDLIRTLLARVPDPERFARYLERAWLDAELAAAHLLSGTGDANQATRVLGPARAAELRERVELAWCAHNPTRARTGEPLVLEADVKHVPELVVKVFRVDPLAYFHHARRELGVEVDLDGIAASHEFALRFAEPPVRRVRRRIELPMCARPGTYVVDLIGNGISSRAIVRVGRLRWTMRVGAAGHVVTVLDEAARPLPGARAWLGDREYVADGDATFAVPFSTAPGATPMLLAHGDVTSIESLPLVRESYELDLTIVLDRQQLTAGRSAKAIARLALTCAGEPASLALLERASWDVTLTDHRGVATTKSQPLALTDDDAAILEWPLGEHVASVRVAVRGTVKSISEQRELELERTVDAAVARMAATTEIEALYLARTASGYVVSALGRNGEPRAQRPVTVGLVHHWARIQQNVELATDAHGRIELGELPGALRVIATLGSSTQTWELADSDTPRAIRQIAAGQELAIAIPASRSSAELVRRLSIVEVRGGVPARHVAPSVIALEGGIVVRGLPPGVYWLRGPGVDHQELRVIEGALAADSIVGATHVAEQSRRPPIVHALATQPALAIQLAGATPRTRIHVIATRFVAAPIASIAQRARSPRWRDDRARSTIYVSGRELGDEYRYILERRSAKRFPSLQLDKPGLLLNPWARRATTTDVAVPMPGAAFAPPAMARGGAAGMPQRSAQEASASDDAYVGYDFQDDEPIVLANLEPAADGSLAIPLAELGRATTATIVVDDPRGTTVRRVALAEPQLAVRDRRLRIALDPDVHATQEKRVVPLVPGARLEIADLATAQVHLIDSVERAHAYLLALRDEPALRELAFVTRWHELGDAERRERYSKHACHELHLFLYFKDRAFFDAVIRPYLAHKRTKTFVDQFLLDGDLSPYLEPAAFRRLNAVERALLARRMPADPAFVRLLSDEVGVQPPDPATDTRLVDALIGASALDEGGELGALRDQAVAAADDRSDITGKYEMAFDMQAESASVPRSSPAPAPTMVAAKSKKLRSRSASSGGGGDHDGESLDADMLRRRAEPPMFRAADRTQEWAEHNWWHRTPGDSGADMIAPNRLWRDLARHASGPFLSPWLGLATGSFAEAMCALAVTDLPFVAPAHAFVADGPRLTITAAGNALAGVSQLVQGPLAPAGAPLVVGQSYVRHDDRYRYVDGEQIDNYVTGPLQPGVVYSCLVVVANPTSSRQRIAALVQIPRGSISVGGARPTETLDLALEPYATSGHEYAFYFPAPGTHAHFPVHVARGGAIVAAAAPARLQVTTDGPAADPTSWAHLSQRGSLADVTSFLADANLAAIELPRVAWRMRERPAFDAIAKVLERRRAFDATLWAYALLHGDVPRTAAWLRAQDAIGTAGPVLDIPMFSPPLDAEELGAFEHLEYAPLVNARAHRLGAKVKILNDGFAAQYRWFLELVAHRRAPTSRDRLAAATYLLAQDRVEPALAALAGIDRAAIAEAMQLDYLGAYAACLAGDTARARELALRWRDVPVDRWRNKFVALLAMLDELGGAAAQVVDPRSRDQQQAELAARQPAFELAVDREGVVIQQQHVAALELRFFELDIELLFSRQPFVQSDASRFSFIEPGHREHVEAPPPELRIVWPAALRGKNVVVEAIAAGQRKSKIHYANDLATHVAHQYGQVRVQRASDRAVLPATYVKIYARQRGGAIAFYKDGYTDLRGWFDYATLSTDALDRVERFAILVCSDRDGAAVLEAPPPAR
jgi:hypothetical protein